MVDKKNADDADFNSSFTHQTVFLPQFPEHSYTERMQTLLAGAAVIVAGVPFIDFTAIDLNGNSGGMVFLIDENGIIYASNPSIKEVREFLVSRGGG